MALLLTHAMQPYPLSLAPETKAIDAIQCMNQSQTGCVLVVEQRQLVGIFTERDLLRATVTDIDLKAVSIETLMTRSLITLSASDDVSTAWKLLRQHQIHHLPVVNQQQHVLGLVTERSLLQLLDPTTVDSKPVDTALQASHQHLISSLETIPAGFIAFDQAWRFTYINHRAAALLQRSQQDLLGRNMWEALPAMRGANFEHEFRRAISQQVSVNFEGFYPALNAWFEVYAYPVQDGLFVYCQDATVRRRFYERLHHQAQREQALNRVAQITRNSLDLETVFVTATTEVGQMLHADRADILQHQPEHGVWRVMADHHRDPNLHSIVGMGFADDPNKPIRQLKRLQSVQIKEIAQHPDPTVNQYAQLLPGTWLVVPIHFDDQLWGCLALTRDHQWRWQEAEVELASTVVAQLAVVIQQSRLYRRVRQLNETLENQVQERTTQLHQALAHEALLKRITERVRDSLDEHEILQPTVQDVATELDAMCCDIGLYDLEQHTLTIAYEAIRSEDFTATKGSVIPLGNVPSEMTQTLDGQWLQWCPVSFDRARDRSRNYAVLSCPICDNHGVLGEMRLFRLHDQLFSEPEIHLVQQVSNQCAIALRQTRLYQAVQLQISDLEQLDYLKDDFLSSVSHELRTPLSNIKMATQMLELLLRQSGVLSSESDRISRYFKVLQDECQREINLINDLLDLSRVESEAAPLTLTTLELQPWLSRLANRFGDRMQKQQQRLELDLSATLPPVTTDFAALERALTELLQNACKYTPPNETIRLAAGVTETTWQISVSNTGVEIAATELNRIFDKFYRIPNNDPWKQGGTGLGLALVKRLLDRLGASIHVESANGLTTFTIRYATPNVDES